MIDKASKGFSLITAIFLLVVIAALGTFAVTLSTTQHQSEAMDVLASRAYQAARAGVEWGAFQITHSGVAANGFAADCQGSGALHATAAQPTLPAGTLLSGFSLGIACGATSHVESTTPLWVYQLTATASGVAGATPGSPNYVERQVSVTIAQ